MEPSINEIEKALKYVAKEGYYYAGKHAREELRRIAEWQNLSITEIHALRDGLKVSGSKAFQDVVKRELKLADTSIISKWADLNIFIVRANLMERDMLPVVEGYYKDKKFSNMAILLNGTTSAYSRYGYSRYGYHYGYGYGYGYGGYTKEDKDK